MTIELSRVKAELERIDPDPKPRIENEEIDNTLQTGDSRLLGGAMSIHAPYSEE